MKSWSLWHNVGQKVDDSNTVTSKGLQWTQCRDASLAYIQWRWLTQSQSFSVSEISWILCRRDSQLSTVGQPAIWNRCQASRWHSAYSVVTDVLVTLAPLITREVWKPLDTTVPFSGSERVHQFSSSGLCCELQSVTPGYMLFFVKPGSAANTTDVYC